MNVVMHPNPMLTRNIKRPGRTALRSKSVSIFERGGCAPSAWGSAGAPALSRVPPSIASGRALAPPFLFASNASTTASTSASTVTPTATRSMYMAPAPWVIAIDAAGAMALDIDVVSAK